MKPSRTLLVSVLFALIALVFAIGLYPHLPAQVPTHWDLHGNVNGYMSRFWAACMPVALIVLFATLTVLLPAISPRQFDMQPFAAVFGGLMLAMQGMVLVVSLCVLLNAAGYAMPMPRVAMLSVGALFMVIGNYMGKLRKNFFIGIRTPWTLASDAVWERTHRLAAWLFVFAGFAVVVTALTRLSHAWQIAFLLAAGLIPCVYSLLIYRRIEHD